jgi:cellobiose transport system substrate-binding protein
LVDLREYGADRRAGDFLAWKWQQGTDPDGRVIGYGVEIGPEGLCFRGDLLAAAGIAQDRDQLAQLLNAEGGGWDVYFDLGRRYHDATGGAWFDQSGFIWDEMVDQLPVGYYTVDGALNVEGNAELQARWDLLAGAIADGLSAAQSAWDWNGGVSFVDGTFATFVCPGWMLEEVTRQIEIGVGDADIGWDFADVFPGGAGNWGGSFLAVPESSEHKAAAAELASWLTEPEQQVRSYMPAIGFPSTLEAIDELAADAEPNDFFNDALVNTILASRAQGVTTQPTGPDEWEIGAAFGSALWALEQGTSDADTAWEQALAGLDELIDG